MVTIIPKTNILESMRKQSLQWNIILGEFIDNAFDAGATRIAFRFHGRELEIVDDGVGCKNPVVMVRMGDSERRQSTVLGRYGIGCKDGAISAADAIEITTIHKGTKRSLRCDWRLVEKTGAWEIADPIEEPAGPDDRGTIIRLSPIRSERGPRDIDSVIQRLSLMYTPGIKAGRQILIQRKGRKEMEPVLQYQFPPLEHQMTADLEVAGKRARVTVGLVPEGVVVPANHGITISYGYRVIKEKQRLGLGAEPTPGLIGWVELGVGWELTKNKDNISSNLDALGREINRACREVIERAVRRSQSCVFSNIGVQLNSILQEISSEPMPAKRRAKRGGPTNPTGAVSPQKTGRRHTRAAVTQPNGGLVENEVIPAGGLKISFEHMGSDGPASRWEHGIVYLNSDIPLLRREANNPIAVATHAVYAAAAYLTSPQYQGNLPFPSESGQADFERTYQVAGYLLSRLDIETLSEPERQAS